MELTVNLFGKGLLMDTNPMVLDNGTLSDALNATFITMNGDEVILLNDMGNRRVDGAFLPPGYLPVGMKEYGGIIYVAAYNPITNRSQIGSFPSPERNILPDEFDGKKFINLDLVYDFETRVPNCFYTQEEEGIPFLVNKSFLIPITDDTSLHAGDKFTIYSTQLYTPLIKYYHRISRRATVEISESEYSGHENDPMYFNKIIPWGTFVSNFDNITGEKVTSPKNKKYTLAVGVMNSLHEFVDITKSLVRWDENGKIINTSEDSELIKFNKGYFIAPIKTSVDNTINDNKFIENRQISALNTYSFKLVGPLYLKATLNTIESFSYKLILSKEGNNIIVKIIADISYNCPDGVFLEEDDNNFGYSSLEEGEISSLFTGFDFFTKKIDENTNIKYIKEEITNHINLETKPETKYDINTNLYHVQMTKTYTLSESNYPDGIIKYYICVSDCPDYYIKELSHKGEIDILLINSGTVNLDEWNYNWDNGILNYELLLYPTASETYLDLYLHYQNITEEGSSEELVLLIKGDLGQGVIYLSYKKLKDLEPNSMYLCSLSYTSVSANSVVKSIGNIEIAEGNHTDKKLWIMTTPFFDKETRKDFFNINEVYVSHNFDAKLEVNEEDITYNEYEKIPYVPSQTEVNEFDFTNTINCEIPISTTYNNQTTLKDIPEEVAVLDFNGLEIWFNIDQYISTYDTLDTQTKGDITDWDDEGKTEINFTIEQLSLGLYFNFEPFHGFPIRPTGLRNYVDSIVYTYGSDNTKIIYSGSDLKQEMIIPFLGGVQSSLKINLKGGHELSILYADIEAEAVFSEDFSEVTFSRGTPGNPYIEYNIDNYSSSTHHAPSIHDSTTTSFNYVIEGIKNHTLNATFKLPALFSASQLKVTVRNYLTSAKDALIKLINELLKAPQVEIEYFTNEGKFCLEKSNDSTTNVFERLDSPETIKLESFEPTRNNTYNQKPNITEITEDNANWDIRDNRILYAGVGMDLSSTKNISEENDNNNTRLVAVIRVWLKYLENNKEPKWALLWEYPTNYDVFSEEMPAEFNVSFEGVRNTLKDSELVDTAIAYYGKFSNEIREIEDLWAINKINYYFISEIGILVTLDYTYEIPPNSIEITNILLNNGYTVNQIPEFILQTPASELMTKSTLFNLYSNRLESTEFASDMNKLRTNGSYIDYWTDNPIFNKHLDEIEPGNTLFKINRAACSNSNTYYIYIGLNEPEGNGYYSTDLKQLEKGDSYYVDVWLKIGKDISNFKWNISNENKYHILLIKSSYVLNGTSQYVYIAIPCQQNNNLLNVTFINSLNNTINLSEELFIKTITYKNVLYKVYRIEETIWNDLILLYPKISSTNLEESNVELSGKIIDEQWNNKYLYGNTVSEGFWPSLPITTGPVRQISYTYQVDQNAGGIDLSLWEGKPMLDLTECPKVLLTNETNESNTNINT